MSIARIVIRTIAAMAAVVASLLLAPGVGSAVASPTASTESSASAVSPTATTGTDLRICRYYNGTLRGCGYFYAYGERLFACDYRADGRTVKAQLYWSGAIRASVSDGTGAQSGCGYRNLSIAEGRTVYPRTCVSGLGCSGWLRGRA